MKLFKSLLVATFIAAPLSMAFAHTYYYKLAFKNYRYVEKGNKTILTNFKPGTQFEFLNINDDTVTVNSNSMGVLKTNKKITSFLYRGVTIYQDGGMFPSSCFSFKVPHVNQHGVTKILFERAPFKPC